MPRSYRTTSSFSNGAIAPQYLKRNDERLTSQGVRTLKNLFVTSSGSVKTRSGSTRQSLVEAPGGSGYPAGFEWQDLDNPVNSRILPFKGRFQDYLILLTQKTPFVDINVSVIDPVANTVDLLGPITYIQSTGVNISDLRIDFVQVERSMILVSDFFEPHRIFGSGRFLSVIDEDYDIPDTIERIQFYKEIRGSISHDPEEGAPIIEGRVINGSNTRFNEEFNLVGGENINIIYFAGAEHTIQTLGSDTNLQVGADLGIPGFGGVTATDFSGGIPAARRWPVWGEVPNGSPGGAPTAVQDDFAFDFPPQLPLFAPSTVTFHQGRLIFANSSTIDNTTTGVVDGPMQVWMSSAYDLFVIQPATDQVIPDGGTNAVSGQPADSPIQVEFNSGAAGDEIRWVRGGRDLIVGTKRGEFVIAPSQTLTPDTVGWSEQGTVGSAAVVPEQLDSQIMFVSEEEGAVHGLGFRDQVSGYKAEEVSIFAQHISDGVKRFALSSSTPADRIQRVFMLKNDGTMLSVARTDIDQIPGFSEIDLGPGLFVEDVVVIKNGVYMLVRRLTDDFTGLFTLDFTDTGYALDVQTAAIAVGATPATTWTTNETYLYNKTVVLIGTTNPSNQRALGAVTLDGSGNFTSPVAIDSAIIGLPVDSLLVPHTEPVADNQGVLTNRKWRLMSTQFSIFNSFQATVDGITVFPEVMPSPGLELPRRTDISHQRFLGWGRERQYEIRNQQPYTIEVTSITEEYSS